MKKYFILASIAALMISCADDSFLGENPNLTQGPENAILFKTNELHMNRAEKSKADAADLLGKKFYVYGAKGYTNAAFDAMEPVFKNYLVEWAANSAGATDNTNDWAYVGDGTKKALDGTTTQSIKYWDYAEDNYYFVAFSTGNSTKVTTDAEVASGKILVTAGTAPIPSYTFKAASVNDFANCYVTNVEKIDKSAYNQVVNLKFHNLAAKVRLGLYENVPGYKVTNVEFYEDNVKKYTYEDKDGTVATKSYLKQDVWYEDTSGTPYIMKMLANGSAWNEATYGTYTLYNDQAKSATVTKEAALKVLVNEEVYLEESTNWVNQKGKVYNNTETYKVRKADATANGTLFTTGTGTDVLPTGGQIAVSYPYTNLSGDSKQWKAKYELSASTGSDTKVVFGAFPNLTTTEPLGETAPNATFSGDTDGNYYPVIPTNDGKSLTLRVNYTLESIDGSGETIKVWGAKAVVPSTYTNWQSNYAYTYLFKISDKTNGRTGGFDIPGDPSDPTPPNPEGLFPITFDAVVADNVEFDGNMTTITTVATPSITTYQAGMNKDMDEYKKDKDIYVQVANVSATPADLYTELDTHTKLYKLTDGNVSEAQVIDALLKRKGTDTTNDEVNGLNGVVLTTTGAPEVTYTTETFTLSNGATVTLNKDSNKDTGKFQPTTAGTYAFVGWSGTPEPTADVKHAPVSVITGVSNVEGLYAVTNSQLTGDPTTQATIDPNKLYFTRSGSDGNYTYTFVDDPTADESYIAIAEGTAMGTGVTAAADTFYIRKYKESNGTYAVKVIKVVD